MISNAKRVGFGIMALLLISSMAYAGNVTFRCNMAVHVALGNFTPASQGLSAVGSFNGWGGADLNAYALTDGDGDGIYEGTFSIADGSYNYKFVVTEGTPKAIKAWEDGIGDRALTVAGDATLDVSEWNQGVKFVVDMTPPLAGGATFDPNTQYVAAVGNFNNWGSATKDDSELNDDNADNIYEGRHAVAAGLPNVMYKFTIRNKSDNAVATWESHPDRPLAVTLNPSETVLVKWDKDPGASAPGNITFRCNMAVQIALGNFAPATEGISAVGSFNGWQNADLSAYALNDGDGDGIYEGTFNIDGGSYAYKFVVTTGSPKTLKTWEASADRPLNVNGDATLDVGEWSQGVRFRVDMTPPLAGGATFDPNTQYVAVVGNFNGWGGATRESSELTDANGDNIYEGRHLVAGGLPSVMYKFTIRNQSDNAVATWESHPDRPLKANIDPAETELVKWDSDPGTPVAATVLFQVNVKPLRDLGIFDETDGDSLVCYGGFNGWNGAAIDQSLMRQSLLDPAIFEITLPITRVPGVKLEYKYFIRFNRNSARFANSRPPSGWEEPGTTGGGNRSYEFTDQTQQTVGVQTFQDIITVLPKDSTYNVTFQADMRCALRTPGFGNAATDTLFLDVFDSFWHFFRGTLDQADGESGPLIPFSDADGDSIYNLTLNFKGPVHNWVQYKLNWNNVQEANPGIALGRNRVRYARATGTDTLLTGEIIPVFAKNYTFGRDVWNFDSAKQLTVESESGAPIDDPIPCVVTAVEVTDSEIPDAYGLSQNYPNPFNPSTTIEYRLAKPGHVKLVLLNTLGQRVATLVDAQQIAGSHRITVDFSQVDARKLASGVYLYRLEAGDFVDVKKLVLAK